MYNKRPTKTGGKAIIELKKIIIGFFPVKFVDANMPAIGRPIIQEIKSASEEIFKDKNIISYKSGSKDKINLKESDKTPIY